MTILGDFACIECGASLFSSVSTYNVFHKTHKRLFAKRALVACSVCGLMQIYPIPTEDELCSFYMNEYRSCGFNAGVDLETYPYDSASRLSRGRALRGLACQYAHIDEGSSVLEIGAGYGHNLFAFKERVPTLPVFAVESDPSCHPALKKSGATIIDGYWGDPVTQEAAASLGPYDVVLLAHVLEHAKEPRDFFNAIRPALKPNGIVVLEVPNEIRSVMQNTGHSPHLTFFEKKSLHNFLTACRFEVLIIDTCGPIVRTQPESRVKAICKKFVPGFAKEIIRKALGRSGTNAKLSPDIRKDLQRIPIRYYEEYGGDRTWLRAVGHW